MATVIKESGVHFTVHDLRRTFITVAESLDISAYALKSLLNHKMSNDVTAGYIIKDAEAAWPHAENFRSPAQVGGHHSKCRHYPADEKKYWKKVI